VVVSRFKELEYVRFGILKPNNNKEKIMEQIIWKSTDGALVGPFHVVITSKL
jgi:hypothetical protein